MNTKISLKRISVATITGSIVMLVLVPLLAGAAPSAIPTGGNVDANFNTVKVGYGITAPSVSVDIKGLNIGINAEATDAIDSTGGEFFGHSNGVLGESLSAGGIGVRGTGIGATGYGIMGYNTDINGTAGLFQQAGMNNSVFLATPTEALRAQASGVAMPAIYANSSAGHAIEAFAADNSKVGITSQGGYAGGQFLNRNNVSDNFVYLGTLTRAISAIGPISNNTWEVSKIGAISSPQEPIGASSYIFANSTDCTNAGGTSVAGVVCTLPIRLFDNEGIKIGNNAGSVNLEINGTTGAISNPGAQNGGTVKIADDQGFEVGNTAGTVEFAVSSDGTISNPGISNAGRVRIQDNAGVQIDANNGTTLSGLFINTQTGGINVAGTNVGIGVDATSRGGIVVTTKSQAEANAGGLTIEATDGSDNWGGIHIKSDNGGLKIDSPNGGIQLNTTTGGIANTSAAQPIRIADAEGLQVSGPITATGKIKASSIGTYTTRYVSDTALSVTATCNSGEIAVSCGGHSAAGLKTIRPGRYGLWPGPYTYYTDRCYAYDGDAATSITAYAFCFNPNG